MAKKNTAVVLLNMGGPDSTEAVEPFLYNLFMDEQIIKLPFRKGLPRQILARLISRLRSGHVKQEYAMIGGRSPIVELTENQRAALEVHLNTGDADTHYKVFTAFRYWRPFTKDAMQSIISNSNGISSSFSFVVLLPLYPQYSRTTTGSCFSEWKRCILNQSCKAMSSIPTYFIRDYHDHNLYIRAINGKINEALDRFPQHNRNDVFLLFSAHGTPLSEKKSGDPYSCQIEETIQKVVGARGYDLSYSLSYQSRLGPMKWLGPYTKDVIRTIRKNGGKYLLVVPVSFVTDHIETLVEIGIEYKQMALKIGFEQFEFTEGLNTHPDFIAALADSVRKCQNKI